MDLASRPQHGSRWRNLRGLLAVPLVLVLVVPVFYLFGKVWAATGDSAATLSAERSAVAYARPVDRLLAALVAAQGAAVHHTSVDPAGIKAAVDDIAAVDRRSNDPLRVRQRWTQLHQEVDNTLSQNATGADALRAYAGPIALAGALLDRLAIASKVTQDPGPGSYQLTRAALHSLPDATVNAGQVSALAATTPPAPIPARSPGTAPRDPALAVAADRLARAVTDIGTGLRAGTDPGANYAVDLNLLKPLDEFTAAADALGQTAAGLDVAGSGARDRIDPANALLQTKALALEAAVLDAFDAQINANSAGSTGQRRLLILLAVIMVLAGGALLWLWWWLAGLGRRGAERAGRHGYPSEGDDGLDGPPTTPDPVDAFDPRRQPQLVRPGHGLGATGRQDRDDRR
jgi:hypothetical protein